MRVKFLTPAANNYTQDIRVQNVIWQDDLNTLALTGGVFYCADLETIAVVTDGTLTLTFAPVSGGGGTVASGVELEDLGPITGQVKTTGGVAVGGGARLQ